MNSSKAWVGILSEVFQTDISSKLDFVDITWSDLHWALEGLSERQIKALWYRYGEELSFEKVGEKIGHPTNSSPLDKECTRQLINAAIRILKHPNRKRVFRSAIVAWWNLTLPQPDLSARTVTAFDEAVFWAAGFHFSRHRLDRIENGGKGMNAISDSSQRVTD